MNILAYGNNSGSTWWRLEAPFLELNKLGHDAVVSPNPITESEVQLADIIVLQQGIVDKKGIALIYAYQKEMGKKLVVDMDDWIWPNDDSPLQLDHKITNAPQIVEATLGIADLITTTNPYLADKIKKVNKNVVVLPNYIHLDTFDLPKLKNESDRIRIGWAGSVTHFEDIKMIREPLIKIAKEFPEVKLIFVGDTRMGKMFEEVEAEASVGVPMEAWPAKLHSLRLDIAIAPLLNNEFNRCKSNIKWQEYSIAQYPGVYSNTVYQLRGFEPNYGLIAYDNEQWYQCIKNLVKNEKLREDIASGAYARVTRRFSLKKNIKKWEEAYESLT